MIQIENLFLKINGLSLLNDFNISLNLGKRIGITGPSGCGKSTFIKSIILNNFPKGSNYKIFKSDISDVNFKIGYIPQNSGLLPWFSLKKNLELFSSDDDLLQEIITNTELSYNLNSFPHNLSGGEQQRALLACSIALKPKLFIADEPLTEIDFSRKKDILNYWSKKIKEFNSSLLIVSHDIDTLLFMCDEIILLSDKPSEILKKIEINNKPHPRSFDIVLSEEMIDYKRKLINKI